MAGIVLVGAGECGVPAAFAPRDAGFDGRPFSIIISPMRPDPGRLADPDVSLKTLLREMDRSR